MALIFFFTASQFYVQLPLLYTVWSNTSSEIGPEVTLRPLATSCSKDYNGHSLVQTSFIEPPNRVYSVLRTVQSNRVRYRFCFGGTRSSCDISTLTQTSYGINLLENSSLQFVETEFISYRFYSVLRTVQSKRVRYRLRKRRNTIQYNFTVSV